MTTLAPKLPYTHPFAGGYPRLGGQPLPTDPDAIDYLERVAAADGAAVEVGVAMAVDQFIKGCKADGIWDAIKASCIMCGARTISGALVPLVGPSPTAYPQPVNFVSSDYSRTTGLKGDGATKYLDSNRAGNADGKDDAHIATFITQANTIAAVRYAGITDTASPPTSTMLYDDATFTGGYVNASTITDVSNRTAINFFGATRSSSSEQTVRVDGAEQTASVASVRASSLNSFVFCRNLNGAAILHTDARLAFYSIGSAISDLAALDNRVSTLVAAIAAAI